MNGNYQNRQTWIYPETLVQRIIEEIKTFYTDYNKDKSGINKIEKYNNEPTFSPLREQIKLKTRFEKKDIPNLGWLQDLYNGQKNNHRLKKNHFESLLITFNYSYDPTEDTFEKLNAMIEITQEEKELNEKLKIIEFLNLRSKKSVQLKEFVGQYKYFVGARRTDTIYDYIYENELQIFKNGQVEIRNPFNFHNYNGFAVVTTNSSLQIISYDFDQGYIDGIGNILTFDINKYSKLAKLIPGLGLTFDADGRPISTQVLLCTNLSINKTDPQIREYFDDLVQDLRMYCPKISEVEKLVLKHHKSN